ncbi:MAG TPA: Maf family protein [Pyrinomonadaceae bacterium]
MIYLPKLILASGSPRRAEILTSVGWEFVKDVADIDETEREGETPENYVQRLAREKAEAVAEKYEDAIVLGADTTVIIDDQIIGKPTDLADARRMLKMLSGRWHEVLTGVAIVRKVQSPKSKVQSQSEIQSSKFEVQSSEKQNPKSKIQNPKSVVGLQRTRVKFGEMNDEEIEFLVEKGAPLDKAGAYAVQAQAALFIEKIEGDYWNVVGLPVNLVFELVKNLDVKSEKV